MTITAMILAGGKSSRFGSDKSLLTLEQELIVQRLVEQCSVFADEIFIVSNQDNKFGIAGVRELHDIYAGMGPLGGIHAGLSAAKGQKVFVTACDMPFLQTNLAKSMLAKLDVHQAVVPQYNNQIEPLFAAFDRQSVLPVAEWMLQNHRNRMIDLFDRLDTYYWQCTQQEHRYFYNINYKEDYEKVRYYKMA